MKSIHKLMMLAVTATTVNLAMAADMQTAAGMVTNINTATGGAQAGAAQITPIPGVTGQPTANADGITPLQPLGAAQAANGITPIPGAVPQATNAGGITPLPTLDNMQPSDIQPIQVTGPDPLMANGGTTPIPGVSGVAAPPGAQVIPAVATQPQVTPIPGVQAQGMQPSTIPGTPNMVTPVIASQPQVTPIPGIQNQNLTQAQAVSVPQNQYGISPTTPGQLPQDPNKAQSQPMKLVGEDGEVYTPPPWMEIPEVLDGKWVFITSDIEGLRERIANGTWPNGSRSTPATLDQFGQPIDQTLEDGTYPQGPYGRQEQYSRDMDADGFSSQQYADRQRQRRPNDQGSSSGRQTYGGAYDKFEPEAQRFDGRRGGGGGYGNAEYGQETGYRNAGRGQPNYDSGGGAQGGRSGPGGYGQRSGAGGYNQGQMSGPGGYGQRSGPGGYGKGQVGQSRGGGADGDRPVTFQCEVIPDEQDGRGGARQSGRGTMTLRCYTP